MSYENEQAGTTPKHLGLIWKHLTVEVKKIALFTQKKKHSITLHIAFIHLFYFLFVNNNTLIFFLSCGIYILKNLCINLIFHEY